MDAFKTWLIEVGLNKLGPSAIRGGILGITGWLMTRSDMLAKFGIVSDGVNHLTTIHWDQLSVAAIAGLPALLAAVIKLVQHHSQAVISGAPQSGAQPTGGTQ